MLSIALESFFELASVPKNSHKLESENDYHFLFFFSRVRGLGSKTFPSIIMIYYISHIIVVLQGVKAIVDESFQIEVRCKIIIVAYFSRG